MKRLRPATDYYGLWPDFVSISKQQCTVGALTSRRSTPLDAKQHLDRLTPLSIRLSGHKS